MMVTGLAAPLGTPFYAHQISKVCANIPQTAWVRTTGRSSRRALAQFGLPNQSMWDPWEAQHMTYIYCGVIKTVCLVNISWLTQWYIYQSTSAVCFLLTNAVRVLLTNAVRAKLFAQKLFLPGAGTATSKGCAWRSRRGRHSMKRKGTEIHIFLIARYCKYTHVFTIINHPMRTFTLFGKCPSIAYSVLITLDHIKTNSPNIVWLMTWSISCGLLERLLKHCSWFMIFYNRTWLLHDYLLEIWHTWFTDGFHGHFAIHKMASLAAAAWAWQIWQIAAVPSMAVLAGWDKMIKHDKPLDFGSI
jgi:hypothetical protein